MAERRMFAKTIIDSDAFLDMPLSTQALYFHLSMRADDDGFINNPKRIQRLLGCSDDDMKILNVKKFLIPFDSGVVVIKHWKIHNYIRKDRYKETVYQSEKSALLVKENQAYTIGLSCGQPNDTQRLTQVRLGKDSIDKVSLDKDSIEVEVEEEKIITYPMLSTTTTTSTDGDNQKIYGKYNNVCMTKKQYNTLLGICASQKLLDELIDNFSENIEQGKEEPYKDKLPNAHYIRIVKYFDYRRKNPDKFIEVAKTKSRAAEVTDKWYEEMKGQGYGT